MLLPQASATQAALQPSPGVTLPSSQPSVGVWSPGPAELVLAVRGGNQEFTEVVPIEVTPAREAKRGTLTISTSVKNWTDDTEPQPEQLRIALRPLGRLAAGFENTLLVRVTYPTGNPYVGPIEVHLLDGEFGVRWRSPVGPVRVDIARGLKSPDSPFTLHLNIGADL